MAFTHNQFKVIYELWKKPGLTQREIAERTGLGLATVNAAYKECSAEELIEHGRITAKGMAALRPYAVDNAVILAAGLSSRFALSPTSAQKGFCGYVAISLSSAKSSNCKQPASTTSLSWWVTRKKLSSILRKSTG